jgi:hypothetical protein
MTRIFNDRDSLNDLVSRVVLGEKKRIGKRKKGIEKKTPRAMVSLKRFVGLIEAKAHGIRTPSLSRCKRQKGNHSA